MATKEKTLTDAFHETLKDVYFAEKAALKALKKSAKAANGPELKIAFEVHATETVQQIDRLTRICSSPCVLSGVTGWKIAA
jgi:ferritin-like metal-binding protein YciE